jgi:hypothetical protein
MKCVLCEAWVVSEADLATMPGNRVPETPECPIRDSAPEGRKAAVDVANGADNFGALAGTKEELHSKFPAEANIPRTQPAVTFSHASPQLLSQVAMSLEEKMWELQRKLVSTPASEPEVIRSVAASITECLGTFAALRKERHCISTE